MVPAQVHSPPPASHAIGVRVPHVDQPEPSGLLGIAREANIIIGHRKTNTAIGAGKPNFNIPRIECFATPRMLTVGRAELQHDPFGTVGGPYSDAVAARETMDEAVAPICPACALASIYISLRFTRILRLSIR